MQGSAVDVAVIDRDADSLLAELAGADDAGETVEGETHPGATPQTVDEESLVSMHTIPHERSTHSTNSVATTTGDLPQEDPPSSF